MNRKYIIMVSILSILSACTTVVKKPAPFSQLEPVTSDTIEAPYLIGAGDEIELKFFFVPELNNVVRVRPDGNISVMFIQDVKAAGKTPVELANTIRKKLAGHVTQPDMVVSINSFGSQRVYVGGEVTKPGPVQLSRRASLTQVLGEAGWLTPLASNDEVIIIRRGNGGRESVYHVDSGKIISGEDTGQDVMVLAGDVVLVPPSGSVDFDRWMDHNVRQALPFGTSASYVYTNTYSSEIIK